MKRISLHKVMAKLAVEQKVELSVWDKTKSDTNLKKGYNLFEQARSIVVKAQRAFSGDIKDIKGDIDMVKDLQSKAREIGADDYAKSMDSALKTLNAVLDTASMEMKNLEKAFQALK